MNVGIVCYASVGGSGVVATELGRALAQRGHEVHLISHEPPFRWREGEPRFAFVPVTVPPYPLFLEPQYLLAMVNTIVRVARERRLDIVHAHYAVPHATAAYLADQMLMAAPGATIPRTITTLHGTDITLVGSDPSYSSVVAFSIEQSHGVTAVSESLARDTVRTLSIRREIRVIPNFLDLSLHRRQPDPDLRARLLGSEPDAAILLHMSNFRPVKRIEAVVDVLRRVREHVPARLVLVGDGPVRPRIEQLVAESGLTSVVEFAGEQPDALRWLSAADLFLLPSAQESFGLSALEAMACEVPVIASHVGGLPEVVTDGVTGYLRPPDDTAGMAEAAVMLLRDPVKRRAMGRAAADAVKARFQHDAIVPLYERFYEEVIARGPSPTS
jgi:N-acetyl-alpha-D-glucosaminyl L-malate synthase BshA